VKECVHHWQCEIGSDGIVPAICIKCGCRRIFRPKFKEYASYIKMAHAKDTVLKSLPHNPDPSWENAIKVVEEMG